MARLISAAVSPLGTFFVLLVAAGGVALVAPSRRRAPLALALAAAAWLWVWSTAAWTDFASATYEGEAGARTPQELPRLKALVVLGGGVAGALPPQRPYPDLNSAADRVWHAARLYHAGKADFVYVTGGVARPGDSNEAAAMRLFLLDLGVPDSAIRLERSSHNTGSSARLTAEQLKADGIDRVLLVTSALHMRRAVRNFESAGIAVVPAPTDFEVVDRPFDVLRYLPDADALAASARLMHEVAGFAGGR